MDFTGFENYFRTLPLDQKFDFNASTRCPISEYLKSLGFPNPHVRYETFHYDRFDAQTRTHFTPDFVEWTQLMVKLTDTRHNSNLVEQLVTVQEILEAIENVKKKNP